MSRFANTYPDDYEERFESMIDAADFQRKADKENGLRPTRDEVARPLSTEHSASTSTAQAPQGLPNTPPKATQDRDAL